MKTHTKDQDRFANTFQSMSRNAARAVWFGQFEQAEMILKKLINSLKEKTREVK